MFDVRHAYNQQNDENQHRDYIAHCEAKRITSCDPESHERDEHINAAKCNKINRKLYLFRETDFSIALDNRNDEPTVDNA